MRLKRLVLTGFKSFAKTTTLELPSAISAIVGPNGSGKSNVVEGIRWALCEQALKTLRGKKSEDFIFNGSSTVPKMGKASVVLVFDPPKKEDFGYDEIIITRKVYRDGVNEYFINNSQVRLKDVVEMLSKFGLGTSSHHIISQGESDRILSASSKEKREILEDALGLKIYQLKRQEAERKLKRTEENIKQVESLRKEIQPHLKFLKKQAEKMEKAISLKDKLKELCREYFSKEEKYLNKEFGRLESVKSGPLADLKKEEEKIRNIRAEMEEVPPQRRDARISNQIEDLEKFGKKVLLTEEPKIKKIEGQLEEKRDHRVLLERDLGRYEGMIEIGESRQKEVEHEMIERTTVEKFIEKLNQYLEEGFLESVFKKIQKAISEFAAEIKLRKKEHISSEVGDLKKKRDELASTLEIIRREEKDISEKLAEVRAESEKKEHFRRTAERDLYAAELGASNLRNHLKSFEIEEEKLKARKEELESEKQSATHFICEEILALQGPSLLKDGPWGFVERDQFRREIERLKIKLEDSEGIGEEVLKEFQQVQTRDDFFEKELGDLTKAAKSLGDLMEELGEKINSDFQKGVADINREFQNFFVIMFGGGTAELKIMKIEKRKPAEEEDLSVGISEQEDLSFEALEKEEGIEISVNIPRKRIRSLEMLSGGERALTSIALLFAMTQVNPPPFLVLDETDAALDEANSQKYAEMLKDLSRRTQLILVTHNRETMKQAGILYGVTIGSSGVSQILSVKFEEAEELAAQDK